MRTNSIALLVLCLAGTARAQDAPVTVSAGLKAWSTEWSTFTYKNGQPVPAELVSSTFFIPSVVGRWRDYYVSASGFQKSYSGGTRRHEWDLNVGWQPLPGIALGLGYKSYAQLDGIVRYEPKGPIASASAALPLSGAWSVYGSLGLGWLKTPGSGPANVVKFSPGPYRISEVGIGYGLPIHAYARALTLTLGYRTQVLVSNGINADGSGRFNDLTQGLTLGATVSF
jgi:hypothetical protein